ncbi:MAG: cyclase family protein [Clostridia bacterium]|nr:cyclase family protein [Clostridia bacterium]
MKIIDITKEMLSAEVYPGDTAPVLTRSAVAENGGYNVSDLNCCVHNGTHIDAPLHVFSNGVSASGIDAAKCFGECSVITVNGKITAGTVEKIRASGISRVILKAAFITRESAVLLSELKLDLIGVEAQSVGDLCVHKTILSAGTVILEGLDLRHVADGKYFLSALPLKINGADGTPVRAVLVDPRDL